MTTPIRIPDKGTGKQDPGSVTDNARVRIYTDLGENSGLSRGLHGSIFYGVSHWKIYPPPDGAFCVFLGDHLPAVLIIVTATALAATNYGIMLGTLAGSHEQAVVLGPISIVIAAALGGIIVPVYLMPEPMQMVSNVSPLACALDAFYDIFLRGKELEAILPEAEALVLFSFVTLAIAQFALKHKNRG